MNTTIRRRLVDQAVFDFFVEHLPFPVGLAELPVDSNGVSLVDFADDNRRYVVVTPVSGSGSRIGPPTAPEADALLDYDVRVCAGLGLGYGGAMYGADEVERVFFEREAHGEPVRPLVIEKHVEMDRSAPAGFPAATLLDGEWQSTGTVQVAVTRIP